MRTDTPTNHLKVTPSKWGGLNSTEKYSQFLTKDEDVYDQALDHL